MRRRTALPKARLILLSAFVLLIVAALALSVRRYRAPGAAPPEALNHIAEKNRDAAIAAAARQRVESATSTNAAEDLAENQLRNAQANAAGAVPGGNAGGAARRRD